MKYITKLLCVLLCIAVVLPSSQVAFASVDEKSEMIVDAEEKIYCEATIDQEFSGNAVLVVLDKKTGAINKTHDRKFFGSAKIANQIADVVDLTAIPNFETEKIGNDMLLQIDETNFRQILKLVLKTDDKENVLQVIRELEKIDGIVYAGPNYTCAKPAATFSNDTDLDTQWWLSNIQITEAWDITTGNVNVCVGVIDSGIAAHDDLSDNVGVGWDFVNNNNITTDDPTGHGTHVAGIIGAVSNNGIGNPGVAWNVTLVPLQIINSENSASTADTIEAITYAMNHNIPILNHSWWNYPNDIALKEAIAHYPGLYVCIAGNAGKDIDTQPNYPASFCCANMISVANIRDDDTLAGSSNFGDTTVHLAAPGTNITSTHLNSRYVSMTGTSMAAPFVTGVAALIYSIRPDLSAVEIKSLILNNVDEVEGLDDKCITGGRLNAYKAVRAATEPQTFTGDVNGDGRGDMILSRRINGKRAITTYLGQSNGSFGNPITTQSTRNFVYTDPAFVGDFNGDGLTDMVVHWSNNNYRQLLVYISKGNGQFNEGVNLSSTRFHDPDQLPCKFFVADVNGDSCDDFVVHYRNTSGKRCALVYIGKTTAPYFSDATSDALISNNIYYHEDPVYMGDFNGDGYADMMVQWKGENEMRQLLVYKGNTNGTFSTGVNLASTRAHKPGQYPNKYFIADVDGDNKDDYIVHWRNANGYRHNLVYKGKTASPYVTDATTDALESTNIYKVDDPVFVGDINGDGCADMIVHWELNGYRQFLIYTAKNDGTYNAAIRQSTSNQHNPVLFAGSFYVADVNGDGRDDFVVKWRNGTVINYLTYLGTTSGSFSAPVRTTPTIPIPYYIES